MNELKIFESNEFGNIRTVTIGDKPYFMASDVAKALGYSNIHDAILRHCRWVVKHEVPHPQSKTKSIEVNVIPEGDIYRLVANSELPTAEKFESWVFDEVLPQIRQTGKYEAPKKNQPKKDRKLASVNNAAKIILPQLIAAGIDPVQRTYFLKDMYAPVGINVPMIRVEQEKLYEQTEMAEILGVLSKSGKPHAQAIGAIIGRIYVSDDEIVQTSYTKNGHTDIASQYKETVLKKVEIWLKGNSYPTIISNGNKSFRIVYKQGA